MMLVFISFLFTFLGIFLGEKFELKRLSINALFGLFSMNAVVSSLPYVYSFLYKNYHGSTIFYVFLSGLLGYLILKLINFKYESSDNISIFGFVFLNMSIFCFHRFSLLFLIINIIYFILIGIYIKKSKSWIYVLLGCIFGILFYFIDCWCMGFIYGINLGFLLYFVLSIYNLVFRCDDRKLYISLIFGFVVAILGGLL